MTDSGPSRSTQRQGADLGRALGVMIDALVVSPLETGISAVRDPAAAIDRARQELRNARVIGSMVTNGGMSAFRASTGLGRPTPPASRSTPTAAASPQRPADADDESGGSGSSEAEESGAAPVDPVDPVDGALDAESLAVPDYEQLPAIDIVDQLGDLTAEERDAIEAYELAHRRRRTVLGRLDQLRSA